jgi:hypothetical protein
MIMKMLTHMHMVVYTWWCWHIYKGEEVGVGIDQLSEETEAKQLPRADWTLDRTLVQCVQSVVELQCGLGLADPMLGHFATECAGAASSQWWHMLT